MKNKNLFGFLSAGIMLCAFSFFAYSYFFSFDLGKPLKTTSVKIATMNYDSMIKGAEEAFAALGTHKTRKSLMSLYLTRTVFLGGFDKFAEARKLVYLNPKTAEELQLNIKFNMAVHEFDKVEKDLEQLKAVTSESSPEYRSAYVGLNLAKGSNLERAKAIHELSLDRFPNFSNYFRMAAIESELGNFRSADKMFVAALDSYPDVSPFTVAYVYFSRGVMWGEKAHSPSKAKALYERALYHLPTYSSAQVHLGELLLEEGKVEEALAGVKKVLGNGDPEPHAFASELYSKLGDEVEAQRQLQEASRLYSGLIGNFEKAFADHGSEFFMSVGDNTVKALELADANLENRKTQRALTLALEASSLAQNTSKMCGYIKTVQEVGAKHIPLKNAFNRLKSGCL